MRRMAGLDSAIQSFRRNMQDAVHARQVQHDTALSRHDLPLERGSRAATGNRHARRRCLRHDPGHGFGGLGKDHRLGHPRKVDSLAARILRAQGRTALDRNALDRTKVSAEVIDAQRPRTLGRIRWHTHLHSPLPVTPCDASSTCVTMRKAIFHNAG